MNCFTENFNPSSFSQLAVRSAQSYNRFQYPTEMPGRPSYSTFIGRVNAIGREVVAAWQCECMQGDPPNKPSSARFYVDNR